MTMPIDPRTVAAALWDADPLRQMSPWLSAVIEAEDDSDVRDALEDQLREAERVVAVVAPIITRAVLEECIAYGKSVQGEGTTLIHTGAKVYTMYDALGVTTTPAGRGTAEDA